MDKWGYNHLIELKTLWEKEKLLVTSNFSFSHNVFKSCLLLMRQNEYLWIKGLKKLFVICNGYNLHSEINVINIEYVYSAVVYQKYLTRLRELIIFEPWRENYHFSQPS